MTPTDEQATGGVGLNRRQALGIGGMMAGGLVAATAAAAGPADAAAPTKATQELSLEDAQRVIRAGQRYVHQHSGIPPMYFVVVDDCGREVAAARMDGNGPAALVLVPPKARTAAAFRAATADLAKGTTDATRIATFTSEGFSLLPGGRPLTRDATVVGALGVGGGTPEQDDVVAQAAIRAL